MISELEASSSNPSKRDLLNKITVNSYSHLCHPRELHVRGSIEVEVNCPPSPINLSFGSNWLMHSNSILYSLLHSIIEGLGGLVDESRTGLTRS
jgi:hypothetical protein